MRNASFVTGVLLCLACSPEVVLGDGDDAGLDDGAASGGSTSGGAGGGGGFAGGGANGGSAGSEVIGCKLLVAAPLPGPIESSSFVSGPGIVATDTGFVVGYRDQSFATLRARIISLSDSGQIGTPSDFDLGGCSVKTPADGVGLAFANGFGMYAAGLPDCGKGAGGVFIPFDADGNVGVASGPRNIAFKELTVAQGNSLAPATGSNEFEWIYRVTTASPPVVERVILQGPAFKSVPIVHPFGEGEAAFGQVATGTDPDSMRAFVGPDGPNALKVIAGPLNGDSLTIAGAASLPAAPWSAITAWNKRAAVVIPTQTGLAWSAIELTGFEDPQVIVPMTPLEAGGTVRSSALAVLGDKLYVLASQEQRLVLWRIGGATATLGTATAPAAFGGAVGDQSLAKFDGTRIAMAAARGRVVIVWLTRHAIEPGDPTGGYAILTCS